MKRAFAARGLPQRARTSRCATATTATRSRTRVEASSGCPCFVKPANMGSSVGVSKAHDRAELDAGDRRSRSSTTSGSSPRRRSPGREIEVGGARRRPAGGVGARRGRARRRVLHLRRQVRGRRRRSCSCPRRSTTTQTAEAQALAVARVRGVPVRGDGAGRLLPRGATGAASSSTRSTRSPGSRRSRCTRGCGRRPALPYPQLLDRLIELAIERHARRTARRRSASRRLASRRPDAD